MIATTTRITNITLELTEKEAAWLREYVRNPWTKDETPDDAAMRSKFFTAITAAFSR